MTKTQSTFTVLAVTLLVLASFPMFNQPTAVAQSEEGGVFFGACWHGPIGGSLPGFCVNEFRESCAGGAYWFGDGTFCFDGQVLTTQSTACCLGDGGCAVLAPPLCTEAGGTFSTAHTRCSDVECPQPCDADVDGDGTVGILDFLDLLAAWGDCS